MIVVDLVQASTLVLLAVVLVALPAVSTPTLAFGVRVPAPRQSDPVVRGATQRFRLTVLAAALTCLVVAALLGGPVVWSAAVVVFILAGVGAYLLAHQAVLAAKHTDGWLAEQPGKVSVDTSLRTDPVRFPWSWAAACAVVVLLTAVAGAIAYPHLPAQLVAHAGPSGVDRLAAKSFGSVFTPVFAQVGVTLLLVAVARLTLGARAELTADRAATGAARHRHYVAAMVRALLALCLLIDVGLAAMAAVIWSGSRSATAIAATVAVPALLGLVILVGTSLRVGQGGSRLQPGQTVDASAGRDDDALWRGGLCYVNRTDPAVLVPKRFGIGWTLNMGNPLSWAAVAVLLLLVVVLLAVAVVVGH